jgi:hypothetical protein
VSVCEGLCEGLCVPTLAQATHGLSPRPSGSLYDSMDADAAEDAPDADVVARLEHELELKKAEVADLRQRVVLVCPALASHHPVRRRCARARFDGARGPAPRLSCLRCCARLPVSVCLPVCGPIPGACDCCHRVRRCVDASAGRPEGSARARITLYKLAFGVATGGGLVS